MIDENEWGLHCSMNCEPDCKFCAVNRKERTEAKLVVLRDEAVKRGVSSGYFDETVVFTCDDCAVKTSCPYLFDAYNTQGDCLAVK